MRSRKGQTGVEMLISIAFTLFLLVIVSLFASERNREADQLKLKTDVKRVASSIADNINNIAEQGPGFYRYFSIPETVYGVTEYNISVYEDYIEVWTEDYAWSTQAVSSNITNYCLDKDSFKKNKAYNEGGQIYLICHRPELLVLNASLWPPYAYPNESINISVRVMNFGPVDAGAFNVSYNGTTINVPSLSSEEVVEVRFPVNTSDTPGNYPVEIWINSSDEESIITNNFFNGTLNVVERT